MSEPKAPPARRLCDGDGIVSQELADPQPLGDETLTYLGLHNRLAALSGHGPQTDPFTCSGSAHYAGEHIRCTSPAHDECPGCKDVGQPLLPCSVCGRAAPQQADANNGAS